MKKFFLFVMSLALVASFFTGCAVKTGNDKLEGVTQSSVSQSIKNGVTTKQQVRQNFGEPQSVDFMENGLEKWQYTHTRSAPKAVSYIPVVNWFVSGTNDTQRTLVVLFDGDIVKNHSFSSSEGETMIGLGQ